MISRVERTLPSCRKVVASYVRVGGNEMLPPWAPPIQYLGWGS